MRIEGSNRRLSLHRTSPLARFRALKVRKQKEGRRLRHESRDSPSFPTMYGGREALPDDHKFRGQRGRVRARYRRPQLGRGSEKIGETSQRKTNLKPPPGHFLVKLRRSRRQVSARRKLHRAVDAQVATANSIPWSSTAKFSRNGVLVAPLRVTRYSEQARG